MIRILLCVLYVGVISGVILGVFTPQNYTHCVSFASIMDATIDIIAFTITYSVVRGCNVIMIVGVITPPITPTDTQYSYL